MSTIGIAIGATGLALILVFIWMLSLSIRKKRLEEERKQREIAYRKALEKNRQKEREERLMKAESGHIPTILYLAKEAERKNVKEALYWYNKAAELNNVTGMYGIVRISQRMREDVVLKEKARFWQLAINASEGQISAKYEVALAYFHGRGIEKNIVKALETMQSAANEGFINAILFLGDWCQSPDNFDRKPEDAIYWYRKAAELNSSTGRMKLGLCYLEGKGITADHSKACYWLERAAEQGNNEAMYHAAQAWIDRGSSGNAVAYIWAFLSAHFGYEPAKSLRDQVGSNIGVDSVVGLQALAKPMVKKIAAGTVSKHSIIKALNKLYKRGVYIPAKGEVAEAELEETPPKVAADEETPANPPEQPVQTDGLEKLDFSHSSFNKS